MLSRLSTHPLTSRFKAAGVPQVCYEQIRVAHEPMRRRRQYLTLFFGRNDCSPPLSLFFDTKPASDLDSRFRFSSFQRYRGNNLRRRQEALSIKLSRTCSKILISSYRARKLSHCTTLVNTVYITRYDNSNQSRTFSSSMYTLILSLSTMKSGSFHTQINVSQHLPPRPLRRWQAKPTSRQPSFDHDNTNSKLHCIAFWAVG